MFFFLWKFHSRNLDLLSPALFVSHLASAYPSCETSKWGSCLLIITFGRSATETSWWLNMIEKVLQLQTRWYEEENLQRWGDSDELPSGGEKGCKVMQNTWVEEIRALSGGKVGTIYWFMMNKSACTLIYQNIHNDWNDDEYHSFPVLEQLATFAGRRRGEKTGTRQSRRGSIQSQQLISLLFFLAYNCNWIFSWSTTLDARCAISRCS